MTAGAAGHGEIPCRTAPETVQAIRSAERQGDVLLAYDKAQRALAGDPDDLWLKHRAVLQLARSGSTFFALAEFARLGLAEHVERYEDIAGLRARLGKDLALGASGADQAAALESARCYLGAFRSWGGYYAAINAASMMLAAGELAQARGLAHAALAAIARRPAGAEDDAYFAAASSAEAALILGDLAGARERLAAAAAVDPDYSARASTRRQLRWVCALVGADPALLDVLRPPAWLYYVGHMVDRAGMKPRFPPAEEAVARQRLAAAIGACRPDFAVGSLACGTDIICAEILLDRGSELHVVLPSEPELFKKVSVSIASGEWESRFHRCLERAAHVIVATPGSRVLDDMSITYAARVAMGLTLSRARALGASATQIALWDGAPPTAPAGTAADVHAWRGLGQAAIVVPPPTQPEGPRVGREAAPPPAASLKDAIAILFADFAGYSRLDEVEYGLFREQVLRPIADILNGHGRALLHRNTWGDGLYLVFDDCVAAARCALQIRDHVAAARWDQIGISMPMNVRIGGHVGPLRVATDPITGEPSFSGAHVVRAARIEPVAPPGDVLVTEAFAAFLAISGDSSVRAEYVGRRPTAKQYGEMRLFRLDSGGGIR